jgi:hypothetical protein
MKSTMRSVLSVVGMATGLATFTAASAVSYPQEFLGYPGEETTNTRVVTIYPNNPKGPWVNVRQNETVKFVNASTGASFVWRFYTPAMALEVSDIATPGFMDGRHTEVYVSKDGVYLGKDPSL